MSEKRELNRVQKALILKGASLTNAIFICIIISVFSGCLVLISHYQNSLNTILSSQEDLLIRNNSSFIYLMENAESIPYNQVDEFNAFDDDMRSYFLKKHWGFYDILVSKTIFKNDTISKIALVGQVDKAQESIALYVTDYDKQLKLSGNTRIFGNIKVPIGQTEQTYINGQKGNAVKLEGNQSKSNDRLPRINKEIVLDIEGLPNLEINDIDNPSLIVNRFDQPTKIINLDKIPSLKNITCKGNFILFSNNELEIDASLKLKDVLIMAPSVKIASGFKGNIQIIADKQVIVEENALLMYPSSIYVKNDIDAVSVDLKRNSMLIGGLVIDARVYNTTLNRKLTIEENATVVGDVYCYGATQLKGNVIGSVYTDRFFLETEASSYENVILNGSIKRNALPYNFIGLPLFNNSNNKNTYAVIKEF